MTRQNQNLNGLQGLALIIGMMVCSSCATLKPEKIHYNDQALLYEYPVTNNQYIFLRMENGELVDNGNYESFIAELLSNKRRYPFDERMENAPVLSEKDYRAARLYAGTAESLNHEDYAAATQALDSLRKLLPGAMWYSDVAFLEGYAQEKAGDSLMAQLKYNEFIRFSSKKYSERFRGHKYADPNDSLWLSERRYALKFLGENVQALQPEGFPRIVPKYYFNSLQPGYTLNDESRVENSSGILLVGLNTIQSNDLSLGIQWYQHFYKNLDVSLGYFTAPGIRTANLALPIHPRSSRGHS